MRAKLDAAMKKYMQFNMYYFFGLWRDRWQKSAVASSILHLHFNDNASVCVYII